MKTLRASSAPLYAKCPAAAWGEDDQIAVNPIDDAGTIGTAAHECAANIVKGEDPQVETVAQKHGLNPVQKKELYFLASSARKFWEEYASMFPDPSPEAAGFHAGWSGHADVYSWSPEFVRILDWKTTRLEHVNYYWQMMAYLWLLPVELRDDQQYQYVIYYLRDESVEISPLFSAKHIKDETQKMLRAVDGWDLKTYAPGGHCHYCPRSLCCPALQTQLSRTADAVLTEHDLQQRIGALADHDCVNLYERIGQLEKALTQAKDIIKLRAEKAPLIDNDRQLVLRDRELQTIDARKAWPIMAAELEPNELAPAISVSKTALLAAIGKKHPKGEKKQAKEDLMARLEEAGAVKTTTYKVPAIAPAEKEATDAQEG